SLFVLTTILALFSAVLPSSFTLFNDYLIPSVSIIIAPYMIIVGITTLLQGVRPARFFLIAWSIFLIGLVVFVLKTNGFIHHNLFTSSIMQVGSGMEAILLSLALGDRYNTMKKDKENTQGELNQELKIEIREKIEAQEKLKETNKNLLKINADLDNFVYTASHDLKAPVVNIEGLINDLKTQECYDDPDVKVVLDMMTISVEKFKTTIFDLTEITKAQKNLEEDIECIEIKEVIEEIRLSILQLIKETATEIHLELGECSTIMFSGKNFRSIMYNLINNAIKYRSPERKPEIIISASRESNYIVISVRDNGLGISESNKNKVFSMFKRAHDHVQGGGVGLYIVKRIVENYGGKIELESETGKGSVFRIYFKRV
ncbi:MAG TPA: HAMP domain-containing sensor histidine kinase, partial [Cytophagaceae bacterium]|nr:HAMP domain-containing sensor histidine kinase [Cytophagaceae bacterium]